MSGPPTEIWRAWGLQLSSGGTPLANLSNAVAILESDPALADKCYFDTFLQRVVTHDGSEWADQDDLAVVMHMQREVGIPRITRDIVAQAVLVVAHKRQRHCVREWMDSLAWDGTNRIEHFFPDHFGVESNPYTQAVGRNFWLCLPARIYEPGCKVDNMVVLEGRQGIGKSQALKVIAGEWFAEMHESATNPKGFAEILQGKALIEISEMDSFDRAEVNRVKQAITCQSDRYRPSYGHRAQDHKRQCIFAGTTNRDDWNRDETGARRFWPIACRGDVNLELMRSNREQLFAEAVHRHKEGEPHWIMPDEQTKAEQSARFQGDPWLESIENILKGELQTTTAHIAEKLGITIERRNRATEMRIAASLRHLGWVRKRGRGRAEDRAHFGVGRDTDRAYFFVRSGEGGDGGDGGDRNSST